MLCVDFHCHSLASKHATNTIEELLQRADNLGMEGLAITDHCPGIDNTAWLLNQEDERSFWLHRITGPDYPYFKVFISRYQPSETFKTVLFKGIECNILEEGDRAVDVPLKEAGEFDLVIASIHPLPSLLQTHDSSFLTERLLMAMEEPIDVIGHPCHKGYVPDLPLIVKKAADARIVMELNNSSLRFNKTDFEAIRKMLKLAMKHECRISLSSDAHCSNEIGCDEGIRPLLSEVGFPDELIVNRSLTAAKTYVAERKDIRRSLLQI